MKEFTAQDFKDQYEAMTLCVRARCRLERDLAGGMPANETGIRGFVTHHLGLSGAEAEDAVKRIKTQEIDKAPPEGELEEKLTYGLNIVRRSEHGPWLGDWMVKACIKAAASRVGVFQEKRGTKGDVAEMGRVEAIEESRIDLPERIYFRSKDGRGPAPTYFDELRGKVSTIQGSRSIINHVEKIIAGATFSFEFRAYSGKLNEKHILDIFAAAGRIGLGSAKAYELGKFTIEKMTYEEVADGGASAAEPKRKYTKKEAAA